MVDVLLGHDLPAALGEVLGQALPIPAEHVAVGVDADPVVVRDANEVELRVLEQRPLDAAATGVNTHPQ